MSPRYFLILGAGLAALSNVAILMDLGDRGGSGVWIWAAGILAWAFLLALSAWPTFVSRSSRIFELSPLVLVLFALGFIISQELESWRYFLFADEISFYQTAHYLSLGSLPGLLQEVGANNSHPLFASAPSAAFLRLFGDSIHNYRLGVLCVFLSGAIPVFFLVKRIANRGAAWFSIFVYTCSFYPYQFAHFGFNNIFIVPITAWMLYLSGLLLAGGSRLLFFALGAFLGLGLMLNYLSIILFSLLPLLFLGLNSKRKLGEAGNFYSFLYLLVGLALVAGPLLFNIQKHVQVAFEVHTSLPAPVQSLPVSSSTVNTKVKETNFNETLKVIAQRLPVLRESILLPLGGRMTERYCDGRAFDPLTGVFYLLGVLFLLIQVFRKDWIALFILLTFIQVVFALMLSSKALHLMPTRAPILLPFIALFAACGLHLVSQRLGRRGTLVLPLSAIVCMLFLNWRELQKARLNMDTMPWNIAQTIHRELEQSRKVLLLAPPSIHTFVARYEEAYRWNNEAFKSIAIPAAPGEIDQVPIQQKIRDWKPGVITLVCSASPSRQVGESCGDRAETLKTFTEMLSEAKIPGLLFQDFWIQQN